MGNRTLFLALLSITGCAYIIQWQYHIKRMSQYAEASTYARVNYWLESADCSQKTGTFLTVCGEDNKPIPIEVKYPGDYRGMTLLADAVAIFSKPTVNRVKITYIHFLINHLGILILALSLFLLGHRWFSLGILNLGFFFVFPKIFLGPDEPTGYFGLFCGVLASIVFFHGLFREDLQLSFKNIFAAVAAYFLLIGSFLIRQPLGAIGLVGSVLVILINLRGLKKNRKNIFLICLFGIALVLIPFSNDLIFSVRNRICHFSTLPRGLESNSATGFSHILYIGLGSGTDQLGINWSDKNAQIAIRKKYPDVIIYSKKYFWLLYLEYARIVARSPVAVIRLYLNKFKSSLKVIGLSLWGYLVIILAFIYWRLNQASHWHDKNSLRDMILIVFLMNSLVLFQGVLGNPLGRYLYPAKFGFVFNWTLFLYLLWEVPPKPFFWASHGYSLVLLIPSFEIWLWRLMVSQNLSVFVLDLVTVMIKAILPLASIFYLAFIFKDWRETLKVKRVSATP